MHPLRELGLREAHRLHLQKNLAEEGRDDMVDCFGHLIYCSIVRLFGLVDCSDWSIVRIVRSSFAKATEDTLFRLFDCSDCSIVRLREWVI